MDELNAWRGRVRASARSTGADEAPQRRQFGVEPVDQLLEPRDVVDPADDAFVTRA